MVTLLCVPSLALTPAWERAALVDLYTACGGDKWLHRDGWLQGDPCETKWYGVGCNTTRDGMDHVVLLDPNPRLSFNDLDCELPASIGNLTELVWLYLSNDVTR